MIKTFAAGALVALIGAFSATGYGSQFGQQGYDGRSGYNGSDGRDGQTVYLQADGNYVRVDISGNNGTDGRYAENGTDARACRQPNLGTYNVQGARGGNGGHGGNGGKGGDAGKLILQYENVDDLRNIEVQASAGIGGRGARAGYGGYGCNCQRRQWTIDDQTYYCYDGQRGRDGSNGRRGSNGSEANLTLINQLDPLPSEVTSKTITIPEVVNSEAAMLEHIWEHRRSGARNLFAAGSRMPDQYWAFVENFETKFAIDWQVNRDVNEFANAELYLNLNNRELKINHHADVWIEGETDRSNPNEVVMTLNKAMFKSDLVKYSFTGLSGMNRDLKGHYKDTSGVADMLDDKVYVRFYSKGAVFMRLRYEGWVPAELVHVDGEDVTVDIGRLNIHSNYLRDGTQIRVQTVIRRNSGTHSIDLSRTRDYRI